MILTSSKVICMCLISKLNYNKDIMLYMVYILISIITKPLRFKIYSKII